MEVGAKSNEIPMFPVLLDRVDITEAVITADAMHAQRCPRHLSGGARRVTCSPSSATSPACSPSSHPCPGGFATTAAGQVGRCKRS